MITKDKIDVACGFTRLKFEIFDHYLKSNSHLDTVGIDKYVIVYDISYTLSFLENICKLNKDSGVTDSDLEKDILRYLTYGILNTAAHYRHYVTSKLKRKSVVILYSSDPVYYTKYNIIFESINKILNLFPKTIFIEHLENDNVKFIYQHIAYFTAMNIFSMNSKINKNCKLIYIGNCGLSFQMLRIDRNMFHIKHNYIDCGPETYFKTIFSEKDSNIIDLILYRNIDLISTCLSLYGFKNGFTKLESIKHKNAYKLFEIITENCLEFVDKENPINIIKGLNLSKEDEQLFELRLKLIDVDYLNKMYALSKTLLNIWSSKIKSNSVHSFNDFFKSDDTELKVQWLLL